MREWSLRLGGVVTTLGFELARRSPLFRNRVFRPMTLAFARSAVRAWRRGGIDAWARWHLPAMRAAGRARAQGIRRRMAMDVERAADLALVHRYEDPLFGIEGYDEGGTADRAERFETACPLGDYLRAEGCDDFCRVLVHAFETETLVALNPRYRLEPLVELRSAGHPRCRFVHTLGPPRPSPRNAA